jgi:nicotinamide-nucleotide amidase
MALNNDNAQIAEEIGRMLRERSTFLATAESCTGGLISSTLTDIPGSSEWFAGAVVAYSNRIKAALLGVEEKTLRDHGAVSEATVKAMALGACRALDTKTSVAVSGIAGPDGGTPDKPVGTICLAWAVEGEVDSRTCFFTGNRMEIKRQTVAAALEGLRDRLAKRNQNTWQ